MAKLVAYPTWIARHFEPQSAPPKPALERWAIEKQCGQVIAGELYLRDDALACVPANEPQTLTPSDLLG